MSAKACVLFGAALLGNLAALGCGGEPGAGTVLADAGTDKADAGAEAAAVGLDAAAEILDAPAVDGQAPPRPPSLDGPRPHPSAVRFPMDGTLVGPFNQIAPRLLRAGAPAPLEEPARRTAPGPLTACSEGPGDTWCAIYGAGGSGLAAG